MEVLASKFRQVRTDEWKLPSEWTKALDVSFNDRSMRRYLDRLVGPVLEEKEQCSAAMNNRVVTHYRPREQVRMAAQEMLKSKGNGVNIV